jgi:hypothetical protein
MSGALESELKAAFETETEFVQPRPELADRVREGARQHRHRVVAVTAAVCAALLVVAGATYAVASGSQHYTLLAPGPGSAVRSVATVDYDVTDLAASGPYVYVLAGENSLLAAYNGTTGRLIRQVTLPYSGNALAVGPGGRIWVSFSAGTQGGPSGLWLLTPDLAEHSSATGVEANAIVPVSPTSAWVADPGGLLSVQMPAPGQPGLAAVRQLPGTSLGSSLVAGSGSWAGVVGGRDAVLVSAGPGFDAHLLIAGDPRLSYGGSPGVEVSAVATTGSALWVTSVALRGDEASLWGPLVRLNSALQPTTPSSVRTSPALARSEAVWSDGSTVWVATGVQTHALACFRAGQRLGPIVTMPVRGEVFALAEAGGTVYVYAQEPPGEYAPTPIVAYPVPAACR